MSASYPTDCPLERNFRDKLKTTANCRVLELGTKRLSHEPTHHRRWAENAAEYIGTDIEDGLDVDVVADAHALHEAFFPVWFDAVIAVSVAEHLERPWVAATEMAYVLKPGGLLYISTHQSFPVHGYPNDYYRFTEAGLAVVFGEPLFEVLETSSSYEATIIPHPAVTDWNPAAPVFLNVQILARRRP